MKKTADVLAHFEELTRDIGREIANAADVIPAITGHLYFYLLFYIVTFIYIDWNKASFNAFIHLLFNIYYTT